MSAADGSPSPRIFLVLQDKETDIRWGSASEKNPQGAKHGRWRHLIINITPGTSNRVPPAAEEMLLTWTLPPDRYHLALAILLPTDPSTIPQRSFHPHPSNAHSIPSFFLIIIFFLVVSPRFSKIPLEDPSRIPQGSPRIHLDPKTNAVR